jgi:zinc/manganese transport system permease protein
MFAHEFVRNAYLAGTLIAAACGLCGYFVVLRGQVFAGDALSHVAFAGALAAAAMGVDQRVGLFIATAVVAGGIGSLGERARADDVVIGTAFAWVLGLGALFLSLFAASGHGGNGLTGAHALFGSIFGLSVDAAALAAAVGLAVCAALLIVARPLLFSTLDPDVAMARGVPVRLLGLVFLLLLAVVAAEATQAVGALLLLGLLAAPAGAAQRLTASPFRGFALSGALAVLSMWAGLALSYAIGSLPPSSAVIGVSVLAFLLAGLVGRPRPIIAR